VLIADGTGLALAAPFCLEREDRRLVEWRRMTRWRGVDRGHLYGAGVDVDGSRYVIHSLVVVERVVTRRASSTALSRRARREEVRSVLASDEP
jgi:hypothetical protein